MNESIFVALLKRVVGVSVTSFLACALAHAAPMVIEERARIISPNPAYSFAADVSIDGNHLVVAASRHDDEEGYFHDAAFVFERTGEDSWTFVSQLFDARNDHHSHVWPNVAVENGVIAVTTFDNLRIFERSPTGWVLVTHHQTPGQNAMGKDVEIEGGTIVVGGGPDLYRAHVYRKDATGQWPRVDTLTADRGVADDEWVGGDVDISGSRIIVGSPSNDTMVSPNTVHLFNGPAGGPWALTHVLTPPESYSTPSFGRMVAIENDQLLGGDSDPLVLEFAGGVWRVTQRLRPRDAYSRGLSTGGLRADLSDGRAFIAQSGDDDRGPETGSINIFQRPAPGTPFVHAAKLLASDARPHPQRFFGTQLGRDISISGRTVAAAANGAVYVFELPDAFEQPALVHDDFLDGVADGWAPLASSSWAVVSTGTAGGNAYRQTNVTGDARALLSGADWQNQAIEADARPLSFASGGERWFGLFVRYTDPANFYYITVRNTNVVQLRRMLNGSFMPIASATLPVTLNRAYKLRLEAIGTWLRVYVDGKLVLQAQDTAHTHGSAGLTMYKTQAEYDNIVVSASPSTTLFAADFERASHMPLPEWTTHEGVWSVQTDGSRVYRQTSLDGTPRAVNGVEEMADQVIEADAKALSFAGGGVRWFGLMARYKDPQSYYYVTLRSDNTISLRRLYSGQITVLATAALPVTAGQTYRLRFEAIGKSLRVYVDGKLAVQALDDRFTDGQAGFAMFKASAQYDNVRVSEP